MTVVEVLLQYEQRIKEIQLSFDQARLTGLWSVGLLVVASAGFLILGLAAIRHKVMFVWPLASATLGVVSAVRFRGHWLT